MDSQSHLPSGCPYRQLASRSFPHSSWIPSHRLFFTYWAGIIYLNYIYMSGSTPITKDNYTYIKEGDTIIEGGTQYKVIGVKSQNRYIYITKYNTGNLDGIFFTTSKTDDKKGNEIENGFFMCFGKIYVLNFYMYKYTDGKWTQVTDLKYTPKPQPGGKRKKNRSIKKRKTKKPRTYKIEPKSYKRISHYNIPF